MLALPQTNTVQLGPAVCCGFVSATDAPNAAVCSHSRVHPTAVCRRLVRANVWLRTHMDLTNIESMQEEALPRLVTPSVAGIVCGNEPTAGQCVLCHRCPDAFAAVLRDHGMARARGCRSPGWLRAWKPTRTS